MPLRTPLVPPPTAVNAGPRRTRRATRRPRLAALLGALACASTAAADTGDTGRTWLAGDHHVHSEWSVTWNREVTPPAPIRGGDSRHTITDNARRAAEFGLSWMVSTDHGGPGHARVNAEMAYPELLAARRAVPGLMLFYGMEFDVPAAEHASLVIAPGPDERAQLLAIESGHGRREVEDDPARDTEAAMLAALRFMRGLSPTPLLLVNHPSRTATGFGAWGAVTPRELRAWQDAAPEVVVGMEGAPGHQATRVHRGLYRNAGAPTLGGFDQMTATVGGAWDRMLAEGRRFWITASSDSHDHVSAGGNDFFPGEYSKTFVLARHEPADVLDALRAGRVFVATGGLVDAVDFSAEMAGAPASRVAMGGTLRVPGGADVALRLRVHVPRTANAHGEHPALAHLALLHGRPGGADGVAMTRWTFAPDGWRSEDGWIEVAALLEDVREDGFVRAHGNSTGETEPAADVAGEDPWRDLWFYANPIFIEVAGTDA